MIAALSFRGWRRDAAMSRILARYDCMFIDRDGQFLTVDDRDDALVLRTTGSLIARSLAQHLTEWADTQPPLE